MLHCSSFVSPSLGARVYRAGAASASIVQWRRYRSLAEAAARVEAEAEAEEGDISLEWEAEGRLPHTPVLVKQLLDQFEGRSVKTLLDCTVGAGGHAFEIIRSHPEMEEVVGMDVDPVAIDLARRRLSTLPNSMAKVDLIHTNFRNMKKVLSERRPELLESGFDTIVMDLGLSSMQVDSPERGFSYYLDGPLDMRMDPTDCLGLTAESILNNWSEAEIGRILREYGEEVRWRFLANRIVESRLNGGVKTTQELARVVGGKFHPGKYKRAMHPAARVFQGVRIAVNDELKCLRAGLAHASSCLAPGGRLAVIAFHSLEDRIIKSEFGRLSFIFEKSELAFRLLTVKPIVPELSEIERNRRCRSAKLRVIQRMCR